MSELIAIFAAFSFVISLSAAWITHVVWWINLMMNEQLDTLGEAVLAILGTLCPPVGVIHGFIIWF